MTVRGKRCDAFVNPDISLINRVRIMESLVLRYGIIAVFLGSGIEGEPFAIAGGVLAHRHWVSVPFALLAAIGGAVVIDQLWFFLSRHFRDGRVIARIKRRPAFSRALGWIERRPVWFVLLFRFAYGLRAVAPVAIGSSGVSARLFVPLELAAAIVWGSLFTAAGYLFGPAFEAAERRYGAGIAWAAVAISAFALVIVMRRGKIR
jgi:membrane protein DedA with SNARE-associated domain